MAGVRDVTFSGITDLSSTINAAAGKEAKKELGAAQDFEGLLIGQMLHSMREADSGWLGTGDDDAGATAFAFGEDELAKALARSGGLGLSKIISAGIATKAAATASDISVDH